REVEVFEAIGEIGRSPEQLQHLIFTHAHPDHVGSAAAIVRETGARTLHAHRRYPYRRDRRAFSASKPGTWFVEANTVQPALPSRSASGTSFYRSTIDSWGNIAHRWRHRSYSYSWALRGTGRAAVAR